MPLVAAANCSKAQSLSAESRRDLAKEKSCPLADQSTKWAISASFSLLKPAPQQKKDINHQTSSSNLKAVAVWLAANRNFY